MDKNLEKRMYFLTLYNISDIQKGIQCGHAQNEYALNYWNDEGFQDWAKNWKTWIILNGGTSNDASKSFYGAEKELGSMEKHLSILMENIDKFTVFYEPDLNNALTSIAFLVDERVFNKKDYPDFINYMFEIKQVNNLDLDVSEGYEDRYPKEYQEWVDFVGGKQNVFLREFLQQFRLA